MNDPVLLFVRKVTDTCAPLKANGVRLYWLKLPCEDEQNRDLSWLDSSVLSREEQSRAAKFRMDKDRLRFICARKILRAVLAVELGTSPQDVPLVIVDSRPALLNHAANDIRFNISHSGEWVVVGFSRGTEIGVDVEVCRPLNDMMSMARRIMTESEFRDFTALAPRERENAFFRLWVAKEAILKYLGTGFRRAPNTVAIGLANLNAEVWTSAGRDQIWQLSGADAGNYCWAVTVSGTANAMPVTLINLNDDIANRRD